MSGSIGGSRILRKEVVPTLESYISNVLKHFPGYVGCHITGSYNTGLKHDHGDIDIVLHIEGDDISKTKKLFKQYIDSLPDNTIPCFSSGKRAGDKSQLFGHIVTCGYPISGRGNEYVQIDNVIVNTGDDVFFRCAFLDMDAQKQALTQGLARVVLQHTDGDLIFNHYGIKKQDIEKNQEYEFVLSMNGLSLRMVTLTDDMKEVGHAEVWRTNKWDDVQWLLKGYGMDQRYEDMICVVADKIRDERSRRRIIGIMRSMINVGDGERGTDKGDRKIAGIELAQKILNF